MTDDLIVTAGIAALDGEVQKLREHPREVGVEEDIAAGHCQLSRPWYARCVGGAAARVGRSFARLSWCPALTERGRKKVPLVR
jgi:hypothetical protein